MSPTEPEQENGVCLRPSHHRDRCRTLPMIPCFETETPSHIQTAVAKTEVKVAIGGLSGTVGGDTGTRNEDWILKLFVALQDNILKAGILLTFCRLSPSRSRH